MLMPASSPPNPTVRTPAPVQSASIQTELALSVTAPSHLASPVPVIPAAFGAPLSVQAGRDESSRSQRKRSTVTGSQSAPPPFEAARFLEPAPAPTIRASASPPVAVAPGASSATTTPTVKDPVAALHLDFAAHVIVALTEFATTPEATSALFPVARAIT